MLKIDWASHDAAEYACKNWHYSKSTPVPPLVKVGVWENEKFIGVVIFSRGATPSLMKPFGLTQTEGCELTRVALTGHTSQVSRIIRLALNFLKRRSPELRLVVSFADPSEGHHGGIYQAGNWIYNGESSASREYIGPDGKRWHSRMIAKKGWTTVHGKRREVLTPDQCTAIEKPGKHRYLMPLDDDMKKQILKLAKPYPKRVKPSSEAAGVQPAEGGAEPTHTLQYGEASQ